MFFLGGVWFLRVWNKVPWWFCRFERKVPCMWLLQRIQFATVSKKNGLIQGWNDVKMNDPYRRKFWYIILDSPNSCTSSTNAFEKKQALWKPEFGMSWFTAGGWILLRHFCMILRQESSSFWKKIGKMVLLGCFNGSTFRDPPFCWCTQKSDKNARSQVKDSFQVTRLYVSCPS